MEYLFDWGFFPFEFFDAHKLGCEHVDINKDCYKIVEKQPIPAVCIFSNSVGIKADGKEKDTEANEHHKKLACNTKNNCGY